MTRWILWRGVDRPGASLDVVSPCACDSATGSTQRPQFPNIAAGALARPLEQSVRTEFGYYLLVRQDREASSQAEVFRDWLRGRLATE